MKKFLLSFLVLSSTFLHGISGFERVLDECKNGDYAKAWQYKDCTLNELEQLVDRLADLIDTQSYRDRFPDHSLVCESPAKGCRLCHLGPLPLVLDQFLGNDIQTAETAWNRLLPTADLSANETQLLMMLMQSHEPAFATLSFTPGQILCAVLCFAQFSRHNLFNNDVAVYKDQYKQCCGLMWFPLIMAQVYGENLWRDVQASHVVLGDTVEVAWALPVALARYVCSCSPAQEHEIDHKTIVLNLLENAIRARA